MAHARQRRFAARAGKASLHGPKRRLCLWQSAAAASMAALLAALLYMLPNAPVALAARDLASGDASGEALASKPGAEEAALRAAAGPAGDAAAAGAAGAAAAGAAGAGAAAAAAAGAAGAARAAQQPRVAAGSESQVAGPGAAQEEPAVAADPAPCPSDCGAAEGFGTCAASGRCMCSLGRGGPNCTFNLHTIYHSQPVYEGLTPEAGLREVDMQGWSPQAPLYEKLLEEVDAVTVVEVGVWKGLSAAHMASWLKREERGVLSAIDTWLGAPEFWGQRQVEKNDAERDLVLHHGYPSVYLSFLSNMLHQELQQVVVPLPQTSASATVILRRLGLLNSVDLLHIDAAHEYGPVKEDIHLWWPFLRHDGILLGDDYSPWWPGVLRAVREFVAVCELDDFFRVEGSNCDTAHCKWSIRKPGTEWFGERPDLPPFCLHGSNDHYPRFFLFD